MVRGANIATAYVDPAHGMNIDYDFTLNVSKEGDVSVVGGSHDGYPSYEVWAYYPDADPELRYKYFEKNYWLLAPPKDVKVKPE